MGSPGRGRHWQRFDAGPERLDEGLLAGRVFRPPGDMAGENRAARHLEGDLMAEA
jgi:hypothetical protein